MPSFNIVDETTRVPQRLSRERSNRIKRYGPLPSNHSCACVYKTGIRRVRREMNTNNFLQNYFEQRVGDDFLRYECGGGGSSFVIDSASSGMNTHVLSTRKKKKKTQSTLCSSSSLSSSSTVNTIEPVMSSTCSFPNSVVESHRMKDALSSSSAVVCSNTIISSSLLSHSESKNDNTTIQTMTHGSFQPLLPQQQVMSSPQQQEEESSWSLCPDKRSTASSCGSNSTISPRQVFTPQSSSPAHEICSDRNPSCFKDESIMKCCCCCYDDLNREIATSTTTTSSPMITQWTINNLPPHVMNTMSSTTSISPSSQTIQTSSSTFHTPQTTACIVSNSGPKSVMLPPLPYSSSDPLPHELQHIMPCLSNSNDHNDDGDDSENDSSNNARIVCESGNVHIHWGDQFFRNLFDTLHGWPTMEKIHTE
ncbi:hypothetical protein FDP41_005742 [Naegleria fowleri]|uniref:Uncharacterized protein n=1 Tax=Naegleria fowleri TaxID=5763 RepID=A0A6A5BPX4_NAEFO|nr:uncharacterized protein FDP41_005742 [Naegleria fowleri]KAF0974989.1 hypothetical protein FDP41_005742 [Naegleria fowleri]CAG4708168.1 unnamed protein product [Naegleria fowleri]